MFFPRTRFFKPVVFGGLQSWHGGWSSARNVPAILASLRLYRIFAFAKVLRPPHRQRAGYK
jgi:hypothetical protein